MADGFSGGLTAGRAFIQDTIDSRRRNAALNALVSAHGPVAGDPEVWMKAEQAQTTQDQEPYAAPTAQANLAGTQATTQGQVQKNADDQRNAQQMAIYKGAAMLKSSANPDGSVNPDAFDKLVAPNAELFGISPEMLPQAKAMLTAPGGTKHLDQVMQSMLGPVQATGPMAYGTDANGQSVAIQRDKYGNIIQQPLSGTTPTAVTNAQTGQGRLAERQVQDKYMRDHGWTTAQIAEYRASTAANNTNFGAGDGQSLPTIPQGGTAAPSAAAPAGPVRSVPEIDNLLHDKGPDGAIAAARNNDEAKAIANRYEQTHGVGANGQAAPAVPQLSGKPLALRTSAAQQVLSSKVNFDNANQVIGSMWKQISPFTTGLGSVAGHIPGTVATNLEKNAETLKAQAAQAVMMGMKNSQGQTGIGRILASEYKNFTNMFGNLDAAQGGAQYAFHLKLLQQALGNMQNIARHSFKTQYGVDPEAALGMAAPKAGGKSNDPLGIR